MITVTAPIIFCREVAKKTGHPFRASNLPHTRKQFHPNFQGWGQDESLKLKSPPYRGVASGTLIQPRPNSRLRAQPCPPCWSVRALRHQEVNCARNVYKLNSRCLAGKVYPHEIGFQETRTNHRKLDSQAALSHRARGRAEMRALRKLRRDYPKDAYVFVSERGGPISPIGFHRLIQRVGEAAKMPFPIHPHMLRHACGFKLANDGHDTRALQHYLGHKNIQHTVRYTEMAPDRFKDFWRD